MALEPEFDKVVFLLRDIYSKNIDSNWLVELLTFSEFEFERHGNKTLPPEWHVFNLTIHLEPNIYAKHFTHIENISEVIKKDIQKISVTVIGKIKILPDYDKVAIINSEIRPVYTEWEEINLGQSKLIDMLKKSSDSFDFQNIGNTARSILQKIASLVFKPNKHNPQNVAIDVSPDKYKNRLHSYIKAELTGKDNKELRDFSQAAIETVEKAIDLANVVTHKLESERVIAEVCVIATISAISVVKLVEKRKNNN